VAKWYWTYLFRSAWIDGLQFKTGVERGTASLFGKVFIVLTRRERRPVIILGDYPSGTADQRF